MITLSEVVERAFKVEAFYIRPATPFADGPKQFRDEVTRIFADYDSAERYFHEQKLVYQQGRGDPADNWTYMVDLYMETDTPGTWRLLARCCDGSICTGNDCPAPTVPPATPEPARGGVKYWLVIGGAVALAGGAVAAVLLMRRGVARSAQRRRGRQRRALGDVADVDGGEESLRAMPDRWWTKPAPRQDKICYRSKTDALNKFRQYNQAVIDDWGGMTAGGSRGEFDALTKYGAGATNIAEALWLALPPRGPFCLDELDLEALNDTSAGREHPVGFQLPDYVLEADLVRREAEYYVLPPRRGLRGRVTAGRSSAG